MGLRGPPAPIFVEPEVLWANKDSFVRVASSLGFTNIVGHLGLVRSWLSLYDAE